MNFKKVFSNVGSLQIYQLIRFTTFLIISIVLTKSNVLRRDIGLFEAFMFIAGLVTFFWVTGLIQSFLSLVNNNKTFNNQNRSVQKKSPEIFNAFILLSFFSLLVFLIGMSLRKYIVVYDIQGNVTYINLLLVYILLSNPSVLIEYIYLVKNRSSSILTYGFITYGIQLVLVVYPIIKGYDILWALFALVAISFLRFVWILIILFKYAEFKFSWPFIKEHLSVGVPLIISSLLAGSAQYIDGVVVTRVMDVEHFAIFRYGAKEFPLVLILAVGLSNVMISEIAKPGNMKASLDKIRHQSRRLMHFLYPATMLTMFLARWMYPAIFNNEFIRSADVFIVYLMIIIPRLVFPHTILIGLKKTRVIMLSSLIEITINISLSIFLVKHYGTVGVALATSIVYLLETTGLVIYNYVKLKIRPQLYIPLKTFTFYSVLLIVEFVLVAHRVLNVYDFIDWIKRI